VLKQKYGGRQVSSNRSDTNMKKVTVRTYRKDTLYPKVVRATAELLKESDEISPVAILMKIGNLTHKDYDSWLHGRLPYLERAFQGSLSKANRYLRIIGFHAHDLNMIPNQHTYRQIGKKILTQMCSTITCSASTLRRTSRSFLPRCVC